MRIGRTIALVVLSLTAGCATGGTGSGTEGAGTPASSPTPGRVIEGSSTEAPDLERLEALYRARADSALLQVSDADVDFMTGMIHHHAQALVMSALAPTNGASASVRTLTARITNAQKDEIAIMQRWLRQRGRPVPEVGSDGEITGMGGMRGVDGMAGMEDHSAHMPGMLSPQQLRELANAHGRDYDRLFLTYMIQHHNGAVTMVHDLFASDGAAQDEFVFKIASDIQVDQTTEVARMQQMLDALPSNQYD